MAMTLITTNTASNAASSSFTSGIDSTYKLYIFKFFDINPVTDAANFSFQVNATDGADYDDSPVTTTFWYAYQWEDGSGAAINYHAASDVANAASYVNIHTNTGNGADESCAGELYLFNPSNTTYVKHFYATSNSCFASGTDNGTENSFPAGYINDTTAIDDINFKFDSGNFDGTIKMYGVG